MIIVDYYFHSPSPWAYLAGPRFNELIKRKNLQVNWKPIDLFAIFKITGQKMVKNRAPQVQINRLNELRRWSEFLKMPINVEPKYFPPDGLPANKLIIAAIILKKDVALLVNNLMEAVWVKEKDIGRTDVIIEVANDFGYEGKTLYDLSNKPEVKKILKGNTEEAIDKNIFGVPTWIYNKELFWGQDRLDFLERAIDKNISNNRNPK